MKVAEMYLKNMRRGSLCTEISIFKGLLEGWVVGGCKIVFFFFNMWGKKCVSFSLIDASLTHSLGIFVSDRWIFV